MNHHSIICSIFVANYTQTDTQTCRQIDFVRSMGCILQPKTPKKEFRSYLPLPVMTCENLPPRHEWG